MWEGNLFPGNRPQSVYTLDTDQLTQLTKADGTPLLIRLQPGQTSQLPDGRGSISFDKVDRFAGLSARVDPGKELTLVAAIATILGLMASLLVRRRRIFVRVRPTDDPSRTLVTIGGLARTSDPGLGAVTGRAAHRAQQRTLGMPSAELVGYSNLALYSAMAVFTVSMLLFAAYLAALGPVAAERGSKRRSRELVAAGSASVGTPTAERRRGRPTDAPPPADAVHGRSGAGVRSAGGRALGSGAQDRQHRAVPRLARHPAARRLGRDARARGHASAVGQHVRVRDGGGRGCRRSPTACSPGAGTGSGSACS